MDADQSRDAVIDGYGILEDTDRAELRELVQLAAQICQTPMATLSIFSATEQHHLAAYGFDGVVLPLEDSLCLSLKGDLRPVMVADAQEDGRLADNPFVAAGGPEIRLFATEHLTTPEGVTFGSLCVADVEHRTLSPEQLRGLTLLARRVVDALEYHVRNKELAASLAQMAELRDNLQASNKRLQDFAAQVSHDLKTPLTSIGLSLDLALEQLVDVDVDDDVLWLLERAIHGTSRMGGFIDRNLEFAAITGGMRTRNVDLGGVLEGVIADLGGVLDDVSLTVEALPVVEVDPVQMRSVLQNLIHNAVKYRDPERSLTITIRSVRCDLGWRIEVEDNGSGLSAVDRVWVFEAHARAHLEIAGSGLGLDTSRRLVEAHGGTIGLDAAPIHGTIAWFELPD